MACGYVARAPLCVEKHLSQQHLAIQAAQLQPALQKLQAHS
jgi:hypothetical protein